MEKLEMKQQVIKAGQELSRSGLIARTWGNVSCRTDDAHFAITASGRNYMTLTPEEVIEVNMEDLTYEGDIKPSSEKKVHREIYRLKKDAGFVIHTHQSNASAVSAMGLSRIKLDKEYPGIGSYVLCAGYGLPGTKKLCRNTAAAINEYDGKAVIMSNHGAICYGRDYDEAFEAAHTLEEACGKFLENLGVEPWRAHGKAAPVIDMEAEAADEYGGLWNCSPVIMKYMEIRKEVLPYLDDFAQLVGPKLEVVDEEETIINLAQEVGSPLLVRGKGALCAAKKESDAEALSIVIEKNCRAALAAIGSKPINRLESLLMRQFYLKKYSKREG